MSLELGDYINCLSGPAFKSSQFTDNSYDVPLVKGDNLAQGYIKWEQSKYWPAKDVEEYKKYYLEPGDIVLAMDRPWVTAGLKFARIRESDPESLVVQRIARLRAINGMSQDFLHALIGSKKFEDYVKNIMGGTNVPHISAGQIKAYKFDADKSSFAKIGRTYKLYTDLIENNRRRIQLLEESARLLYKEWFVHLRFPGHEHVKIKDGVPEGWEMVTAYDVMDVLSGGTPKTKVSDYWDGEIPFFTPKDTTGNAFVYETEKYLTEEGLARCNSKLYPKYTLFITARGTVGKVCFAQQPMAMNQSCYALVGKAGVSQQYLYCALVASIEQFKARAGGAVFDAIVVDTFKRIPFLRPSDILLKQFNEFVEDVFNQVDALVSTNRKLAEARDILLPRLMSGDLAV